MIIAMRASDTQTIFAVLPNSVRLNTRVLFVLGPP